MAFAEVTVIVDGAVDRTELFTSEKGVANFIKVVRAEAQADGVPTQVFVLWHFHDVTQTECECVQYQTDGRPLYEWNKPDGSV
jgi:hypothetical protein